MTLVMAFHGAQSVWLSADRRLTYPGDHFVDGACKMLEIEASDGLALLGYAGLGASVGKTQPSDWMNDLLANIHGRPLEEYLGIIADAMKADMPAHLATLAGAQGHHLLAASIVNGEPRLYAVILELRPNGGPPHFVYTRYARTEQGGAPPKLAIAGSGALRVPHPQKLSRELAKIVAAVEAGRVDPRAVTDRLAKINAAIAERDKTVGRQCIVKWRFNGGGYQFYEGTKRVNGDLTVPTVVTGMDVRDIISASRPFWQKDFEAMRKGELVENNGRALQTELDKLSNKPKRKL
jgi:hypothetical protein